MSHPVRRLTCRVVALEDATHDIRIVRLQPLCGEPLRFAAGQYAALAFDGYPPRDYSMANRPDEPILEFHIRRMGEGTASHHVARHLKPGELVRVEGPFGDGYLRSDHRGPLLAVAGGSGLAPVKSIVETALALAMPQDIHLYFGARDERDIYLEAHFLALGRRHPNLRFVPVLSESAGPTRRRTGLVNEAVAADHDTFAGYKAYLAGPPAMVEAVASVLEARGMRTEDIHADAFYTEAEKASRPAAR